MAAIAHNSKEAALLQVSVGRTLAVESGNRWHPRGCLKQNDPLSMSCELVLTRLRVMSSPRSTKN
jgi:hypothetical protein